MIELGIASGPPVEQHGYTSMHTAAAEAYAEHGLYGAMVGAVEIAAAMFSRAFSGASVEPSMPALSPAVLSTIARRLITSGETCYLIDVDGGAVRLTECSAWSVVAGGPRPETWRYQCETPGPHTTETRTVPGRSGCPLPLRHECRGAVARARTVDARRDHGPARDQLGAGATR